ncbi:glycerol-3-phosphate 1-O-acyltransferase PlsY [Mycoplasmatota bacterium zrk1]
MNEFIWIIIAYLLGSIPFSLIIGMVFKKIDIRNHGSGNLGGTNAVRVLGAKYGVPAGLLDISKALIVVYLASSGNIDFGYSPIYLGVAATIGHCYPLFAKFRGGKAVSTTMGTLLGFSPVIGMVAIVIAIIVILVSKYVSVGSTVLGLSALLIMIFNPNYYSSVIACSILFVFIIYRHIPNYKRLANGTENKLSFGKN